MANFEERMSQELERQKQEMAKPNLMVVGGTGVGKSSLVNMVFGRELAEVGNGVPVTKGCMRYEMARTPLVIYDTVGYEYPGGSPESSNFHLEVLPKLRRLQGQPLAEQIHLVWYCLSVANHRVTGFDEEIIRTLSQDIGVKLAVVFTQCDLDTEKGETATALQCELAKRGIANPTFQVSTAPGVELEMNGLMEWSQEALPDESMRRSFIAAQRQSLEIKRTAARKVVAGFSTLAAAEAGLNPFPLSDAALLIPTQILMIVKIGSIFGFDSLGEQIGAVVKGQITTLVGRQMAASLLKLIPFLGNVVNALVAGTITGGLGLALIEIYSNAYREYLNTEKLPDWSKTFEAAAFGRAIKEGMERWKGRK